MLEEGDRSCSYYHCSSPHKVNAQNGIVLVRCGLEAQSRCINHVNYQLRENNSSDFTRRIRKGNMFHPECETILGKKFEEVVNIYEERRRIILLDTLEIDRLPRIVYAKSENDE